MLEAGLAAALVEGLVPVAAVRPALAGMTYAVAVIEPVRAPPGLPGSAPLAEVRLTLLIVSSRPFTSSLPAALSVANSVSFLKRCSRSK